MPALDPLSTSQTKPHLCPFGAPLVAMQIDGAGRIFQSCCNHWECPCCGVVRAKQEYRRIVYGCEVIAREHQLYFWTLTCRGREISLAEAEENYYAWTNVLLTNLRTTARRSSAYWAYVQVTERQHKTRAHPHSHIITSYRLPDAVETRDGSGKMVLVSQRFARANASAGLGVQHTITEVRSAAAVSRYVAKYMFKDTMTETFPPKWKRVRYSENFPKLPVLEPDFVAVLRSFQEWRKIDASGLLWVADNETIYQLASHRMQNVRSLCA